MHEFPPPLWPLTNYGFAALPWPLVGMGAAALLWSLRVTGGKWNCLIRTAALPAIPLNFLSHPYPPKVYTPNAPQLTTLLLLVLLLILLQGAIRAFWRYRHTGQSWKSLEKIAAGGVALGVIVLLILTPPMLSAARQAGPGTQCRNNLKQIGFALHNYHDVHHMFPMASQPAFDRSWRVTLLPFMDHEELYERYDQDAPWNSLVNAPLASEVISPLDCPSRPFRIDDQQRFLTAYTAVTGPGAAFERGKYIKLLQFSDGTSNTMMVTESSGKRIVWTEPRDGQIDVESLRVNTPGQRLHESDGLMSSYHLGGAQMLLADGSVRFVSENTDAELMKKLVTRNGEPLLSCEF